MPERLRKLPKLPGLSKLQALLLIGGAFVFGLAAWAAMRLDFFVDRTPSAPENAVLAATIDRTSPEWQAFESKLPEGPRQGLVHAGDLKSVTLFAVPNEAGGLDWGMVEALSSINDRTGRKTLRLVPKGTAAVGFVALDGRPVPFTAFVSEFGFRADIGRAYRGPSFDPNPFSAGRRLLTPLQNQVAYVEKPADVSWNAAASRLGGLLQRFQPQAALWGLPGRMELAVSASGTDELNPFLLYYQPDAGGNLAGPEIEAYAKALLAEADPVGTKVALPDDTSMIELRRDPEAVLTSRKPVGQHGDRAQLSIPGGKQKLEIFYANIGETWLSTSLDLIQASLIGDASGYEPTDACERGGRHGFAAFTGNNLSSWPYLKGLSRVTFSIHNMESGMFTTCGYFDL